MLCMSSRCFAVAEAMSVRCRGGLLPQKGHPTSHFAAFDEHRTILLGETVWLIQESVGVRAAPRRTLRDIFIKPAESVEVTLRGGLKAPLPLSHGQGIVGAVVVKANRCGAITHKRPV